MKIVRLKQGIVQNILYPYYIADHLPTLTTLQLGCGAPTSHNSQRLLGFVV